jgi:branched-chain amino acid transport system ATP-binding protein
VGVRLAAERVRAGYGRLEVLHGVGAVFPSGTVTAVLGPNGAGKTTLLRVLAGLLRPSGGRVSWDGVPVLGRSPLDLSRRGMTYVPDEGKVFERLTVAENLRLFARGAPVDPALDLFPVLARRSGQAAGTLSGGERQMLALARAFVRPPEILLADEVGAGLAPAVTARVYAALGSLARNGCTVVVVDQFAGEALGHASIVYAMRRGAVVFAGEPAELTTERLRDLLG